MQKNIFLRWNFDKSNANVSQVYHAIIAMPINALPTHQILQSNSYLGDELTLHWRAMC